MTEEKKFYNNKYFKVIVGCIITAYVFFPISKNKTNLNRVNGIVLSLKKLHKDYPGRDSFNYRFLEITNYEKAFEIFLGKKSWDFKPDLQNVDLMYVGDSISIYYDESLHTRGSYVNNLTYFIDRHGEQMYVRGESRSLKVYAFLIVTILLSSLIIYLSIRFGKKSSL